jgi:tripartite-type tricarboxylate transporter receptor subunit TctC
VLAKWTQVLARAGADKAVMNQISATGCDAEILTPAQTAARVATDHAKWGRVVKEANIRAD